MAPTSPKDYENSGQTHLSESAEPDPRDEQLRPMADVASGKPRLDGCKFLFCRLKHAVLPGRYAELAGILA